MARKPDGAVKRTAFVGVRLTEHGAAELDRLRGEESRSAYFRRLLAAETKRNPK